VSIPKYFVSRFLYDSLSKLGGSSGAILNNEQYVIPPDEYRAQEIEITSWTELELRGQVKRGQDLDVMVMETADFEWAVQEGESFDPIHHAVLSDDSTSELVDLEKGDYIFYFAPVSETGSSTKAEINLEQYDPGGLRNEHSLDPTVWSVLVGIFSIPGYIFSLYTFSNLYGAIGTQPLVSVLGLLLGYVLVHTPLIGGVYLDARKTRQVSDFPTDLRKHMIGFLIPIINAAVVIHYFVFRRGNVRI